MRVNHALHSDGNSAALQYHPVMLNRPSNDYEEGSQMKDEKKHSLDTDFFYPEYSLTSSLEKDMINFISSPIDNKV